MHGGSPGRRALAWALIRPVLTLPAVTLPALTTLGE